MRYNVVDQAGKPLFVLETVCDRIPVAVGDTIKFRGTNLKVVSRTWGCAEDSSGNARCHFMPELVVVLAELLA